MIIRNNLWKDGKPKCLTMSYDDGTVHDYRLVEIFNRYGIRGSFHLNSSFFEMRRDTTVKAEDVAKLYEGHEISAHTYTHPTLTELPEQIIRDEILIDRKNLEELSGYIVRGMSYPNGYYDNRIADILSHCGIKYARTINSVANFSLPENFMMWHPTTHHNADIIGLFDKFMALAKFEVQNQLMYIWGHSYEFNDNNNWEHIEEFCKYAGGRDNVWYATNIEIYDYVMASRSIEYSLDYKTAYNPSNISVWISVDDKPVELKPGYNII